MKKTLAKLTLLALAGLSYIGLSGGCTTTVKAESDIPETKPHVVWPTSPEDSYANSTCKVTEETLELMLSAAYKVQSDVVYLNVTQGRLAKKRGIGTCFLAEIQDGKEYFVTCYHVIDWEESYSSIWTGDVFELQSVKNWIVDKDGKKCDIDIFSQNEEADIAILSPKKNFGLEKNVDFASLKLKQGDVAYAVGYPLGIAKFLSQGIVTYLDKSRDIEVVFESAALNPGNSGGPIYVLKDGKPYFAGVAQFLIRNSQELFGAVHHRYAQIELEKAIEAYEDSEEEKTKPEDPNSEENKSDSNFKKKKMPYITEEGEEEKHSQKNPGYEKEKQPYIEENK